MLQMSATECGAACLAMVLGFHRKRTSLEKMREILGPGGQDAQMLLDAAQTFGLRGRGVRIESIDELACLAPGAILHWRFTHFVVFESFSKRGCTIVDPATGRRQVDRQEVDRSFTGIALVLEPGPRFVEDPPRSLATKLTESFGLTVRYLIDHRAWIGRIVALSFLVQALALTLPVVTGVVVDRIVPQADRHLLGMVSLGLFAVLSFHLVATALRGHILVNLRARIDSGLSIDLIDHMVHLPLDYFRQRSTGDLMMRVNSTVAIREVLTTGSISALIDGCLVICYLVVLLAVHVGMGLLVFMLGSLRILLYLSTRRQYRDLMGSLLQAQAETQTYQSELLEGIETVKAGGAETHFLERWSNLFANALNVEMARGRLKATTDALLDLAAIGSPLVVLVFGAHLVLDAGLSLGQVLAATALATGFLTPLSSLVSVGLRVHLLRSYLERVRDVLDHEREQQGSETRRAPALRGGVMIDRVSFRYSPTGPAVLSDISLRIGEGEFVALVGRSGAGKSTLANLLIGFYKPRAGTILYDGLDLATFDCRSVRSQIGVVPQKPYLFGETVRDNIALFRPTATLPEIVEAARRARIHHEILSLPMGYDTVLAGRGSTISGGQAQRIALARALLQQPPILILDEATSELDTITEASVHGELEAMGSTRIVIAHRLSTIQHAGTIVVLEGGRIAQQGTHETLTLGPRGLYRQLIEAQGSD